VLIDRKSGVAFVGGLVFADRVPTTPHADPRAWLHSLEALEALRMTQVVPSHGPVHSGAQGRQQTRDYLTWLDTQFSRWADAGWEMNDVLRAPVPEPFRRFAGWPAEYTRNVAHLYPRYERAALQRERRP